MSLGLQPLGLVALGLLADSTDVTVALTGVSATGQAGSVTSSVAADMLAFAMIPLGMAPLGYAVAGASAGGDVTIALTGVAAAASIGSLGPAQPNALTGVAGTGAVGTLLPSIQAFATAAAASGSANSFGSGAVPAGGFALAALGLAALGLPEEATGGAPQDAVTKALTGNVGTGAVGTVVPEVRYVMAGQDVGSGEQGSFALEVAYGLTGSVGSTQIGGIGGGPAIAVESFTETEVLLALVMTGGAQPVTPQPVVPVSAGGGQAKNRALEAMRIRDERARTEQMIQAIVAMAAAGVFDDMLAD